MDIAPALHRAQLKDSQLSLPALDPRRSSRGVAWVEGLGCTVRPMRTPPQPFLRAVSVVHPDASKHPERIELVTSGWHPLLPGICQAASYLCHMWGCLLITVPQSPKLSEGNTIWLTVLLSQQRHENAISVGGHLATLSALGGCLHEALQLIPLKQSTWVCPQDEAHRKSKGSLLQAGTHRGATWQFRVY